jgi:hypothetical protein
MAGDPMIFDGGIMSEEKDQTGTVISEVAFRYTKSSLCRVIHMDGAWGGVTPQGHVQMGLYSEKHEVPESHTYDVVGKDSSSKSGVLRQKAIADRGLVREIEVEVIMSTEVARALMRWLEERLAMVEAAQDKHSKS